MIINYQREKLLNALIYFIENTSWTGKTKLYKLLYYLDFKHFKETGRSVTGLDYFAWEMGPVPAKLQEEIENPKEDFSEKLGVDIQPTKKGKTVYLQPQAEFDPAYFSKRELRLLQDIACRFDMSNTQEMVDQTHLKAEPWHMVWEVEKRHFDKIPYSYVLEDEEKEFIESLAAEHEEVFNAYS